MEDKANTKGRLPRWQAVAGMDFHILATVLLRGWSIVAGGVTILLLPLALSPEQQGYYFTFASVLALQIFFELGLNQVVMQLVSHEVAHLEPTTDGHFQGDAAHLGHLSSLARLLSRWYGMAALLFGALASVVGAFFFASQGNAPMATWLGPWLIVVGATAANLWLSPRLAMLEGFGQIGHVARLRLAQSILGCICFWLLLLVGVGLWAACAVPVVNLLCTRYWVHQRGELLRWLSARTVETRHRLLWRRDVLPLQWRMALSWASGYLIFNLFTPVVFARHGAVEAGRLGMALALFAAISTVGMSWINAKAPAFTTHIARGERLALNALFRSLLMRSTAVVAFLSLAVVALAWLLQQWGVLQIGRLASPDVLLLLAMSTVLNSVVSGLATYMRAHREEPMTAPSVVMAAAVVAIVYWSTGASVFTMMLAYLLVSMALLPWVVFLFIRYFNRDKDVSTAAHDHHPHP